MTRIGRVNAFRAEVAKVLADFPDGVGVSFALARGFALGGRTYAELAGAHGMTRENVRARIVRLIESLALRQHCGEAAGVRAFRAKVAAAIRGLPDDAGESRAICAMFVRERCGYAALAKRFNITPANARARMVRHIESLNRSRS